MPRPVQLYDTLEGKKRPFEPIEPGKAGVYCCGPTVYDMSHIGHARAAIVPDILVRYLRHTGLDVKYVRNITDIDDKIIRRAAESGDTPEAVAKRFTDEYVADMRALGCLDPQVMPTVTGHIAEIVTLIESLIAKDLAYAVDGDVYYRVRGFEGYGKLSKRKLEDMQAGARVDVDARKQDPMDFALWKGAKPGEPSWESPWGPGRPGWHIECSAMSERHLGQTFDIHTGGRDLIFPHHENEIAQSQGAHGHETFARYWVHNGFINFAGEKMSKSLGNFFTIREVMGLYEPEVIRYAMLAVHYRSGLNFEVEVDCPACGATLDAEAQGAGTCPSCGATSSTQALRSRVRFPLLEEADERLAYVYETVQGAREFLDRAKKPGEPRVSEALTKLMPAFEAAMDDDLNTSAALAALSEPLNEANRLVASGKGVDKNERYGTLERFVADMEAVARVVGCFGADPAAFLLARRESKAARLGLDTAKVESLVEARQKARADKDFEASDRIRDELSELGVKVRDTPDGPVWGF